MTRLNANIPLKYEFLLEDILKLTVKDAFFKTRKYIAEGIFSSKSFNQFNFVVEIDRAIKDGKCNILTLKRRGYTTIIFETIK